MYFPVAVIMATIQSKKIKGYKYWYIVESRRVNDKSRPVVLAYLGKAALFYLCYWIFIIKHHLARGKAKAGYKGSLDNLLDLLNNIRLGTILE
jgi:hypothetical protein